MTHHFQHSTKVHAETQAREQAELEIALGFSMEQLQINEQRSSKRSLCSGKGKCPVGTCDTCAEAAGPGVPKKDIPSSGEDPFTDAQWYVDLFGNRVWFEPEPRPDFAHARAIRRLCHDRNGSSVLGESSKDAPTRKQYMEYNRATYPGGWEQFETINFPPWWRDRAYHELETAQHEPVRTVARKHTIHGHNKEQYGCYRPKPTDKRQPIEEGFNKLSLRESHRGDKEKSQASFISPLLRSKRPSTSCLETPPDINGARHMTPQRLVKASPDSGYGSQSPTKWPYSYGTPRSAPCIDASTITGLVSQHHRPYSDRFPSQGTVPYQAPAPTSALRQDLESSRPA